MLCRGAQPGGFLRRGPPYVGGLSTQLAFESPVLGSDQFEDEAE
jgi:hypothetical protein